MLFYDCLLFLDLKLQASYVICSALDRYPTLGYILHYHTASPRSLIRPKPSLYIAYSIRVPFLAISFFELYEIGALPRINCQPTCCLASLHCWDHSTKYTNPSTIRSLSYMHPPIIRTVLSDNQSIIVDYCCVITPRYN